MNPSTTVKKKVVIFPVAAPPVPVVVVKHKPANIIRAASPIKPVVKAPSPKKSNTYDN